MKHHDYGLLITRIGLGLLFVIAGFGKITGNLGPGIQGFSGMVWGSVLLAWIIALVELVGGISLLVGKWTTYAGWALAIVILGALFLVHFPAFNAKDPMTVINVFVHIALLGSLVGIALTGPGACSMAKD